MRRLVSAVLTPFALLALATCAAVPAACSRPARVIHMATTTSVDNSGLLATLRPEFEKDAGLTVLAVAVGSGRALDIDRRDATWR
jgi:tungstate transport system substrate-binding protein